MENGLKQTEANYSHGGNIYKASVELGISEEKIIDFSASINPMGISEKVKQAIVDELDGLTNYPDTDTKKLRDKLALFNEISPESILCSNGSTELIYLIPRSLKPGRVLVTAPTFSEYERAVRMNPDTVVRNLELKEEDGFRIDPDRFISAMAGMPDNIMDRGDNSNSVPNEVQPMEMAFLCNPNNPAGNALKRNEVLKIAEAAKKLNCFLVIDEAFIDFLPAESVICDVAENPFLIVLRSMTKFYAMPGLRIGYGVFHRSIISRIKNHKEPWSVNSLAQKAALTALEDMDYAIKSFELIKKEKEFIEESLNNMSVQFAPSAANFFLLKLDIDVIDSREIIKKLRRKGLLVRECSNFAGLDSSFIRIAVKTHKENRVLMNDLAVFLKEAREKNERS